MPMLRLSGRTNPKVPKTEKPIVTPPPAETTPTQAENAPPFTWLMLCLLIALCLGSLASFSLAPSLLASTTPLSTPTEQTTTGGCTAKPDDISYLQQPTPGQNTVPSSWTHAGKNAQQFALAQACAAAFTTTYQSLNIDEPSTLTAAASMLSTDGKTHFYQDNGAQPKDARLTSSWQLHAQQVHLQQIAQPVSQAQLQTIQSTTPAFSASFVVRYKLTTLASGIRSVQYKQLIILLQQASTASPAAATGWQIEDWYNGS
jgi:hypothetical protein